MREVVLNKVLRGTTSSAVFQKLLSREYRLFSEGTLFARSDEFRKHSNDPDQERESIVFRLTHPGIPVLGAEEIAGNSDVFSLIEQLIGIRAQHPALVRGRYAFITTGDARTTYSFVRTMEHDTMAVIMNISNEPRIALLKGGVILSHQWQDVVTKNIYTVNRNGLSVNLPACGFAVLQPIE